MSALQQQLDEAHALRMKERAREQNTAMRAMHAVAASRRFIAAAAAQVKACAKATKRQRHAANSSVNSPEAHSAALAGLPSSLNENDSTSSSSSSSSSSSHDDNAFDGFSDIEHGTWSSDAGEGVGHMRASADTRTHATETSHGSRGGGAGLLRQMRALRAAAAKLEALATDTQQRVRSHADAQQRILNTVQVWPCLHPLGNILPVACWLVVGCCSLVGWFCNCELM